MTMFRLGCAVLLMSALSANVIAGKKELKRVDQFPSGEQTSALIGSFLAGLSDWNREEHTFDSPFSRVWAAAKVVAYELNTSGGQPVTGTDEVAGRIHVGRVSQDQFLGMGPGTWVDEMSIELKRESDSTTTVMVLRKVVQKEMLGDRKIKTQKSNGKVERYILTRISDVLAGRDDATGKAPTSGGPAGNYVSSRSASDFILLKQDGTCFAQQAGFSRPCRYEINGSEILLTYQGGVQDRMSIEAGTLKDPAGTLWQKPGSAPPSGGAPALTLTNDDISKMAAARLPDGVMVSRIKESPCRFDLTPDALIKLKAAGVSDTVLEAMTGKR